MKRREMYFLFTDETKITEPLVSDATDELEEVADNTATFGDGLNDHSGGGEGEEGSGVNPAGTGRPPRHRELFWKCAFICCRHFKNHRIDWCVPHCLFHFYCKAHPSKCPKKKTAHEEQEGMPFIEKESAEA